MKIQLSPREVAESLFTSFGFVALGTNDNFTLGEEIPQFQSVGVKQDLTIPWVVTGLTTFQEYEKQGRSLGYDVRDCFDYYFRVEPKAHS